MKLLLSLFILSSLISSTGSADVKECVAHLDLEHPSFDIYRAPRSAFVDDHSINYNGTRNPGYGQTNDVGPRYEDHDSSQEGNIGPLF